MPKTSGAQPGNQNAYKGRMWRDAIRYALAEIGRDEEPVEASEAADMRGLRKLARKFIAAAEQGDPWAFKELADRMDGKAAQQVQLTGADEGAIEMKWTVEIVEPEE